MTDEKRPHSFDEFDARLEKLRQQERRGKGDEGAPPQRLDWGAGLQIGIEILAGIGGGLLLGWALDRWLGTGPLFLIVFFLLGAAAGMLNAWRRLQRWQTTQGGS